MRWVYGGAAAAILVSSALWGLLGAISGHSQATALSVEHLHATKVSRASHAFCNCLAAHAPLDECLASAETGDGIGVTDQELLLATCLDHR